MRYILRILFPLLLLALTAACGQRGEVTTAEPTPTPPATPTLAGALVRPPTPVITPWPDEIVTETAVPDDNATPTATTEPTASPTPSPTATPVLTADERRRLATLALHNEDFPAAIDHLQTLILVHNVDNEAVFDLGRAYLGDGRYPNAIDAFTEYLAQADEADATALFLLAQARRFNGDCAAAVPLYQEYMAQRPTTAPYAARPLIQCQLALGDRNGAILTYETAVSQPAHRITEVENRLQLAQFYLDDGRYAEAIAQYEAIINVAQTEATRGQANYLIGSTHLLAGEEEAAFAALFERPQPLPPRL
jgi:tetratricopeptide (TPR) repeat protein